MEVLDNVTVVAGYVICVELVTKSAVGAANTCTETWAVSVQP